MLRLDTNHVLCCTITVLAVTITDNGNGKGQNGWDIICPLPLLSCPLPLLFHTAI